MEELSKRIEQKAYDFFLQRGMVHGDDVGDWLRAEKDVLSGEDKKSPKEKIAIKKKK